MTQDRTRDSSDGGARADVDGTSTMDLSGRCVGSSYVLQRPIGQGATGTVWVALDRASGESVAVKLLHESLLRQPRLVTRFVQERTILRMLRHRNVVRVRDLFSVGETLGLVMDLVPGGNLRDLLRERHTLAAGEAARLTAQVAAALAEAHDLGIVHRDLKPDNILLAMTDGRPDTRLTDFGIARILNTPSLTTPNAVVGTPHYMSPEAFHGSTASPATDVYALGVLLYELVTGHPPYRSDSIPDLMRQHLEGNPERRPGIPDPVWQVITACMARKPRLRPNAPELVARLSDLARRFADVPALPRPEDLVPAADSFPPRAAAAEPPLRDDSPGRDDPADRIAPAAAAGSPGAPEAPGDLDPVDAGGSVGAQPPAPAEGGGLPPHSVIPHQRPPRRRNAVPSWRWARPGATLSLVAGAVVATAVATTAWNHGRADGQGRQLAAPLIVTAPATPPPAAGAAPAPRGAARVTPTRRATGRSAAGDRAVQGTRTPAADRSTTAPAPAVTGVRAQLPKPAPARSPRPEARQYGPWQCRQSIAFDFVSRTPLAPQPCQMTGRDIQYRASLTAPGGGHGTISVTLQDAGTGRTVAGPKTCAGLTFEGRASTRSCGPAGATPARGRDYAVVMSYRYERDGRTLVSTAKGRAFSW